MISLIAQLLLSALTLLFVAYLVPGISIDNIYVAIISAVILGILNILVKPILVILTLPITIVTLGLFIFVINAFIFLFVASFIEGFTVDGFIPALIGSILVSVISLVTKHLIP
jgi:putative membrane protein